MINVQAVSLPFELEAKYVYMINIDTNEIMCEKNAYEKMYPASLTKIMSAIVAIEAIDNLDDKLTITYEMMAGLYEANASMAGFQVGNEVTYRDLLYGVLLPSGAECTQALAYSLYGSVEIFVAKMNEKAAELGMKDTNFVNTTGLHDENHYSTCYDLSLLLKYAINNPTFYEIFTSKEYTSTNGIEMHSSSLSYLGEGAHMIGAKTGFTNPAGRCLASISDGEERYMIILAKAPNDAQISKALVESNQLYDYFYDNYYYEVFYEQGSIIKEVKVRYSITNYDYVILSDKQIALTTYNDYDVRVNIPDVLEAPIVKGDILGAVEIEGNDGTFTSFNIYAAEDIKTNFIINLFWPMIAFGLNNTHAAINILIIIILLAIIIKLAWGLKFKRIKNKK